LPVSVTGPIDPTVPLPVGPIPASVLESFFCTVSISVLQVPALAAPAASTRPAAVPNASNDFNMTILLRRLPLSAGNSQAGAASVGWHRISTAGGNGCSAIPEI
jgi:hypothetical protein